ncbi:MAG: histidine ammonia-lyase [Chloroflexi bacterium]|nr:histidine ammonia-lyase [Chloroflexota bacterium]MCL5075269.1 histidine ammonia-lyase [Chloroflexota bacterium]
MAGSSEAAPGRTAQKVGFEPEIVLDGQSLTIKDVIAVARYDKKVALSSDARRGVLESYEMVQRLVEQQSTVYGVTTGFGHLCNVPISAKDARTLQRNLILSHSAGVGPALEEVVVRAIMLLRANALAKGHSGVSPEVISTLIAMLNAGVHPLIPAKGSVGASGDLAPLSHMVLVMLGEGEAIYRGQHLKGREALERCGIAPVQLGPKEGLALINGTQVMTALGILTAHDGEYLLKTADIAAAMTSEALRADPIAFDSRIHSLRPHQGQAQCAFNLRSLLEDSDLYRMPNTNRVQDPYSLRCIPQVHGASREAIAFVKGILTTEMNSATDNPLLFPSDGLVISGGNFHGEPVAMALDLLGIALAEIASISERRLDKLLNPVFNELPTFLTRNSGLNSGLMLTQYTAAALVSENKILASPASVDSIPTSAGQEDHVSMGTIAARKGWDILTNTQYVVAIELLAAAQALDLRQPGHLGRGVAVAYDLIRSKVAPLTEDRILAPDIEQIFNLVRSGELVERAAEVVTLI